jgi:hypothetical protein
MLPPNDFPESTSLPGLGSVLRFMHDKQKKKKGKKK